MFQKRNCCRAPFEVGVAVHPGLPGYPTTSKARGDIMEAACFGVMPADVLIVEDDPIIALDFEDTLAALGVKTIRTVASVAGALAMIAERAPDFALLDVALVRENTFAVAERLDVLAIPYVFVTGYGAEVRLPPVLADKPRLAKPCARETLEAALRRRPGQVS